MCSRSCVCTMHSCMLGGFCIPLDHAVVQLQYGCQKVTWHCRCGDCLRCLVVMAAKRGSLYYYYYYEKFINKTANHCFSAFTSTEKHKHWYAKLLCKQQCCNDGCTKMHTKNYMVTALVYMLQNAFCVRFEYNRI